MPVNFQPDQGPTPNGPFAAGGSGGSPAAPPYVRTDQPNIYDAGQLQTFDDINVTGTATIDTANVTNDASVGGNVVVAANFEALTGHILTDLAVDDNLGVGDNLTVTNNTTVNGDITTTAGDINALTGNVNAVGADFSGNLIAQSVSFGIGPGIVVSGVIPTRGAFWHGVLAGGITIDLPPDVGNNFGDAYFIKDVAGVATLNPFSISGNGSTIDDSVADVIVNIDQGYLGVFWSGAGWEIWTEKLV